MSGRYASRFLTVCAGLAWRLCAAGARSFGGQTTYRLTNIVLAEPDRSLFQVPADYSVKQEPARIDVQKR
jgi:hypothetical protein